MQSSSLSPLQNGENAPFPEAQKDTQGTNEKIQAIDFAASYQIIQIAIDYVRETRTDFEKNGPQKWIIELLELLENTLKTLHDLEAQYIEELVDRKDETTGKTHQVLLRIQDENKFDEALQLYTRAQNQFNHYFETHFQMLQQGEA
ncbi:MAG TPA: hypothetical protein VJB65_05270 [Patescibacteria group bacterium]|nr:hypothetical protein [Patescibacteria group bacterium]